MQLLRWVKAIFGQPDVPAHDYVESALLFPELDVPRMIRRMRLQEEGRDRGRRNEPPTGQASFDHIEARIVTAIQGELRVAHELYARHMRAYGDRQAALKVSTHLAQLVSNAESAGSDFIANVRHGRDVLFQLSRDLTDMEREFKRFRREQRLDRPPHFPTSQVLHFGIVILLVLIEAFLNGSFLARGLELGMLGGITQALVIAAVNVSSGFVIGMLAVRNLSHKEPWRRITASVFVCAWLCFVLVFNLAVAHYRAALGGDNPSMAEHGALQQLTSAPLSISEMSGWLLFILGCSFSIIAAFDGWRMDDPYPGYGTHARRRDSVRDEYTVQKLEVSGGLESIRDTALQKMDDLTTEVDVRQEQYRQLQNSQRRTVDLFASHAKYLEQCGNELLSAYRQANRESRSTPEPDHFSTDWQLGYDPVFSVADAGRVDEVLSARINTAFEEIRNARQRIEHEYQQALNEFATVESLVKEGIGETELSQAKTEV
jgi:hypothetical protein